MKAWSVIGLLFAAAIFATIPISAQVTPRGVELSADQAQAVTYRRARVTARRVGRREHRAAGCPSRLLILFERQRRYSEIGERLLEGPAIGVAREPISAAGSIRPNGGRLLRSPIMETNA